MHSKRSRSIYCKVSNALKVKQSNLNVKVYMATYCVSHQGHTSVCFSMVADYVAGIPHRLMSKCSQYQTAVHDAQ